MEFAITAETDLSTDWKPADDSWWPQGARSFFVRGARDPGNCDEVME